MKDLIIQIITSRRDVHGNTYTAFHAVDRATGREVDGLADTPGNVRFAEFAIADKWPEAGEPRWTVYETELPIRQFNRVTKGYRYAGCKGAEILAFIAAGIGEQLPEKKPEKYVVKNLDGWTRCPATG